MRAIDTDQGLIDLSLRERYLIAQALVLGIEKLEEAEGPMRESSNMLDMHLLLTTPAFAPFAVAVLAARQAMGKPVTWATLDLVKVAEDEDLPF
tara:strand:+ start:285 stop:566 length:282 start_codon:yes stop_codon:yes gene_type:complete